MPGTMVTFDWWSTYKAPCVMTNTNNNIVWVELQPNDDGIVIGVTHDEATFDFYVMVLFHRVNRLVKVRRKMLVMVTDT